MSKLIEFLNVDEIGSNYSKDSFDPHGFPAELYYDQIRKPSSPFTASLKFTLIYFRSENSRDGTGKTSRNRFNNS